MENKRFLTAQDVMEMLGVSLSYSYKLIRQLNEAERLKKGLLGAVDGDDYLKEQVIELRYQNHILREENRSLKDKLEKAYEFMKQFVIGGMNLLERFLEWIGEKVRDVGRGR